MGECIQNIPLGKYFFYSVMSNGRVYSSSCFAADSLFSKDIIPKDMGLISFQEISIEQHNKFSKEVS